MSAKNWRLCPACAAGAASHREKMISRAKGQYGIATPEEYQALITEAEKPVELEETLREDYQIGMGLDREFYVTYRCSCESCGFSYSFKREEST